MRDSCLLGLQGTKLRSNEEIQKHNSLDKVGNWLVATGASWGGWGPQSDARQRLGAVGSFRVHKSYYAITRQITKCNRHNNSDREQLRRHADWKHNNSSDSNQPVNVEMSQTLFFSVICSAKCAVLQSCMLHCCTPLQFTNMKSAHIIEHVNDFLFSHNRILLLETYKRRILSSAGLESKLESGQREQLGAETRAKWITTKPREPGPWCVGWAQLLITSSSLCYQNFLPIRHGKSKC